METLVVLSMRAYCYHFPTSDVDLIDQQLQYAGLLHAHESLRLRIEMATFLEDSMVNLLHSKSSVIVL